MFSVLWPFEVANFDLGHPVFRFSILSTKTKDQMAPQIFSILFQWYLPEIVGSGVFDIFVAKITFFLFCKNQ